MKSQYTKAETELIMCMTRSRECTAETCKKCGWLSEETRLYLKEHGDEPQWEKEDK
jgi:hypothetical protein